MHLSELPHEGDPSRGHHPRNGGDRVGHPPRGLEDNEGAGDGREELEAALLRPPLPGEEALEEEALRMQARGRHGAGDRRGPRYHLDGKAGIEGGVHQALPRIAHAGHARVAHEGDAPSPGDPLQRGCYPRLDHVLIGTNKGYLYPEVGQEPRGDPRVLAEYRIGSLQGVDHPARHVLEVPDGSAHH